MWTLCACPRWSATEHTTGLQYSSKASTVSHALLFVEFVPLIITLYGIGSDACKMNVVLNWSRSGVLEGPWCCLKIVAHSVFETPTIYNMLIRNFSTIFSKTWPIWPNLRYNYGKYWSKHILLVWNKMLFSSIATFSFHEVKVKCIIS